MNRAQRRQQQRAEKKAQQKGGTYNIDMEMIQPWSDVLMKTKLSDEVIDGKQSAVWLEALNRIHVQKSIIQWCLK